MNNKKNKTTMGAIVGLMVLSGGLIAYENVYVSNQKEANKVTIYVAKKDIQAHTAIKGDMFHSVRIDNTSVLQGYVLDVNSLEGKELKGGLLQGEPLTKQRLEAKGSNDEGNYVLNLMPEFEALGVNKDDHIRVYVQLEDRDTGTLTTKKLFEKKQVVAIGGRDSESATGGNSTEGYSYQVNATEKEVEEYLTANKIGTIKVIQIDELDTGKITSDDDIKNFDKDSEESKNAVKPNTDKSDGQAISTYTVKSGETLESLSLKFKTKKETISALNNGKEEFDAGEMIQVPSN